MSTPTHAPLTTGELELYQVLHRANLLQYYDTFISQGGDDVQQLCEAGEEEFLEIMALVGMASKPLHVRRLQKALQEWVANPGLFSQLVPTSTTSTTTASSSKNAISIKTTMAPQSTANTCSLSPGTSTTIPGTVSAQTWMPMSSANETKGFMAIMVPSSNGSGSIKDESIDKSSSPMPQITLMDNQIVAIEECAKELVKTLPPYSPKPLSMKKQINQDIMNVITLDYDDPNRMDEVRKYSAIYGRFDSKRKNLKPMSLHEICVNEAAAQICRYIPNLLTRRDELFPLARQVVRDSGYQYSKGHSRTCDMLPGTGGTVKKSNTLIPLTPGQISKMATDDLDKAQVRLLAERMTELTQELAAILQQQDIVKAKLTEAKDDPNTSLTHDLQTELELLSAKQLQLLSEQSQIIKTQRRSDRYYMTRMALENGDGTDSLHSGASSPPSSCVSDEVDFKQNDIYISPPKKNPAKTKSFVQKSLFDEGLRIAQQYGMSDFAEEIADMKGVKKEPGDGFDCDDEVEGYNREYPLHLKKECSDDEGEKIQFDKRRGQKRTLEVDHENQFSQKYSCGIQGLKGEKLKTQPNSGDDSLYQSEESCDSRNDFDVNPHYEPEFMPGANNNHKSDTLPTDNVLMDRQ